jgi:uncharacterized membrane protein
MVLFELLLLAVLLAPAVPEIAAAFFTLLLTLGLILIVPTVLISIIFILPFIVFICIVFIIFSVVTLSFFQQIIEQHEGTSNDTQETLSVEHIGAGSIDTQEMDTKV